MVCSRDVCQPTVFFLYYAKFTSSNLRKIFLNFCHWLILWTFSCISKIVVIKRTRVHACCCEANCQQPELHRHRFGFHTHCTKARGRGHTCKFSRKTCRSWCIQFGLTGDLKSIAHDLELCVWSCVSEGVDFTHIEKNIYIGRAYYCNHERQKYSFVDLAIFGKFHNCLYSTLGAKCFTTT